MGASHAFSPLQYSDLQVTMCPRNSQEVPDLLGSPREDLRELLGAPGRKELPVGTLFDLLLMRVNPSKWHLEPYLFRAQTAFRLYLRWVKCEPSPVKLARSAYCSKRQKFLGMHSWRVESSLLEARVVVDAQ